MEYLIEFILELILDGSIEISKNKKISKWIRYPLIFIIILFYNIVILGLFICGLFFVKDNTLIGLLFIALSLFFLIGSIIKFKSEYKDRNKGI